MPGWWVSALIDFNASWRTDHCRWVPEPWIPLCQRFLSVLLYLAFSGTVFAWFKLVLSCAFLWTWKFLGVVAMGKQNGAMGFLVQITCSSANSSGLGEVRDGAEWHPQFWDIITCSVTFKLSACWLLLCLCSFLLMWFWFLFSIWNHF